MKMINSHRVIFFGTSEFAVPALQKLSASSYQLIAVITQPDKPKGRKQELSPSPVKVMAQKLNLQVLQYPTLKSPEVIEKIKSFDAVCAVVASYGKIIPQEILTAFPKGCINLHPSLLPKYRGPSPIQTAIFNGEKVTGTSLMVLDVELDHGPLLAQKTIKISPKDTHKTLHDKLANESAELLIKILPKFLEGKIKISPQNHKKATFTKLLTRDDGKIYWKKSSVEIFKQTRAYSPWPGTWTIFRGNRLKIIETKPYKNLNRQLAVGEIFQKNNRFFVGCGLNSVLEILELQPEGKSAMKAEVFLRGNAANGIHLA